MGSETIFIYVVDVFTKDSERRERYCLSDKDEAVKLSDEIVGSRGNNLLTLFLMKVPLALNIDTVCRIIQEGNKVVFNDYELLSSKACRDAKINHYGK